jgi:hypothetical protein
MDLSRAFDGLFYFVAFLLVVSLCLGGYAIWSAVFRVSDWEICSRLQTPEAIVQCMEALNE